MAALGLTLVGGVAVVVLLIIALGVHRRPSASSRRDGGDSNSDRGGWTPEKLRPNNPPGGQGEPSWWPEFEREFRRYAARSARDQKFPR